MDLKAFAAGELPWVEGRGFAGLAQRGAVEETGELPNMIWLYRRPLLDFWCDGEDSLAEVVTHVLVHEIGHHFGLSDADIEAIERSAR